jgi:hypothetical protein
LNKRQKEVIQANLEAEKDVLKRLERHYRSALADINLKIRLMQSDELTISRLYRIEHQKALRSQVEAIIEKLHSDEYTTISQFLSETYTDAFVGTVYDMFGQGVPLIMPIDPKEAVRAVQTDSKINGDLYTALGVDTGRLKKSISSEITRGLAGGMDFEDIARNISNATKAPLSRAKVIVATEAHRIQEASTYDAQKKAESKGAKVVRQWNSTMDGDTRRTHRKLDGQIREIGEPFNMDGKTAMYPGDFGDPAEDCNCRCTTLQRATWALGENELEILKQRAEFFGLDKTEDLNEFKEKYLKSVKTLEKISESGKIDVGFQFFAQMPKDKFVGYALNPDKAPDKARAFKQALGYDLDNYTELMLNIEAHIDESKFVPKDDIGYGRRYEYVVELEGPNGKKANVLTAWIQDGEEKRLTSVYVTEKKVTE